MERRYGTSCGQRPRCRIRPRAAGRGRRGLHGAAPIEARSRTSHALRGLWQPPRRPSAQKGRGRTRCSHRKCLTPARTRDESTPQQLDPQTHARRGRRASRHPGNTPPRASKPQRTPRARPRRLTPEGRTCARGARGCGIAALPLHAHAPPPAPHHTALHRTSSSSSSGVAAVVAAATAGDARCMPRSCRGAAAARHTALHHGAQRSGEAHAAAMRRQEGRGRSAAGRRDAEWPRLDREAARRHARRGERDGRPVRGGQHVQ